MYLQILLFSSATTNTRIIPFQWIFRICCDFKRINIGKHETENQSHTDCNQNDLEHCDFEKYRLIQVSKGDVNLNILSLKCQSSKRGKLCHWKERLGINLSCCQMQSTCLRQQHEELYTVVKELDHNRKKKPEGIFKNHVSEEHLDCHQIHEQERNDEVYIWQHSEDYYENSWGKEYKCGE